MGKVDDAIARMIANLEAKTGKPLAAVQKWRVIAFAWTQSKASKKS